MIRPAQPRSVPRAATLLVTLMVVAGVSALTLILLRTVMGSISADEVRKQALTARLALSDAQDAVRVSLERDPLGFYSQVMDAEAPRVCVAQSPAYQVQPGEEWPRECGSSWGYGQAAAEQDVVVHLVPPTSQDPRLLATFGSRDGQAQVASTVAFTVGGAYRPLLLGGGTLDVSQLSSAATSKLTSTAYAPGSMDLASPSADFSDAILVAESGFTSALPAGVTAMSADADLDAVPPVHASSVLFPQPLSTASLAAAATQLAAGFCPAGDPVPLGAYAASFACLAPGGKVIDADGSVRVLPSDLAAVLLLPSATTGGTVDVYVSTVDPDPMLACPVACPIAPGDVDLLSLAALQIGEGGPHPGSMSFWGGKFASVRLPSSGVLVSKAETYLGLCGDYFFDPDEGSCLDFSGGDGVRVGRSVTVVVGTPVAPQDLYLAGPVAATGSNRLAVVVSGSAFVPYYARPAGGSLALDVSLAATSSSQPALRSFPSSVSAADGAGGAFTLRGALLAPNASLQLPLFASYALDNTTVSAANLPALFPSPNLTWRPGDARRLLPGEVASAFAAMDDPNDVDVVDLPTVYVPSAPQLVLASPADMALLVSWLAPSSNGGAAVSDYKVQYSWDGGSSWVTFPDGTSDTPSATVTGLVNGTAYLVRVAAVNTAGDSAWTVSAPAVPATVPGEPSGLLAVPGASGGIVELSWSAPVSNGGAAVTDYQVEYSTDSGASWLTFADPVSAAASATVTGLANGTAYLFRVAAVNAAGTGAWSGSASATPRTVPGAPTGLNAVPGSQEVGLSWTAPVSNGGAEVSDYQVEYSTDSGASWQQFDDGVSVSEATTVTGLVNGTAYLFRVAAVNAAGTGAWSGSASATPRTVPGAPTGLAVTPGNGQLSVSFTPPSSDGGAAVTTYEYSLDSGPWTPRVPASTSSPLLVTGLANGTAVQVRLRAVNAAGAGPASAATPGTPRTVPGAPTGLDAQPGVQEVDLSWTAPLADGGAEVSDYQVEYSADSGASWQQFDDGVSVSEATTVTGLVNGTAYLFRVAAVNAAGTGAWSGSASATPRTVPGAPTGLAVVTAGGMDAALSASWDPVDSPDGAPLTGYRLYRLNPVTSIWEVSAQQAGTSFTDTGLTAGTQYQYQVRGYGPAGEGAASSTVSATAMDRPAQVTGMAAVAGSGQVTVSWSALPGTSAAPVGGFYVFEGEGLVATVAAGASSSLVSGLTAGLEYSFTVRAFNDAGMGPASAAVTATPS